MDRDMKIGLWLGWAMRCFLLIQFGLFNLCCVTAAVAQTELYRIENGAGATDEEQLIALSDLDADGVREYIITNTSFTSGGLAFRGEAKVYSGRTGVVIRQHLGESQNALFGVAASALGDLDNDGTDDYVISDERSTILAEKAGAFTIFSGKTGAKIFARAGLTKNSYLGLSVAGLPDMNSNGVPDLAVFASAFSGEGLVFLYDGSTGTVFRTLKRSDLNSSFGASAILNLGDVNGDSKADLAISVASATPLDPNTGLPDATLERAGAVDIISGADGTLMRTLNGIQNKGGMGRHLSQIGDVTGDGVVDIAAGGNSMDVVAIYSGQNGALLTVITTETSNKFREGPAARAFGDFNNDGVGDFVVSNYRFTPVEDSIPGRISIYLGGTFALLQTLDGAAVNSQLGYNLDYLGEDSNNNSLIAVTSPGTELLQVFSFTPPTDGVPEGIDPSDPPTLLTASARVNKRGKATIDIDHIDNWQGCTVIVEVAPGRKAFLNNNLTTVISLAGKSAGSTSLLVAKKLPTPNRERAQRKLFGRLNASCFSGHTIQQPFVLNFRRSETKLVSPRRVIRRLANNIAEE